jgi:hypothetical protein
VGGAVSVVLDFSLELHKRCDAKGCDDNPLRVWLSGVYATADRGGVFLKANNNGSEYVEVVTSGTSVMTTYGICKPKE